MTWGAHLVRARAPMLGALAMLGAHAIAGCEPASADPEQAGALHRKFTVSYSTDGRATWNVTGEAAKDLGRVDATVPPTDAAIEIVRASLRNLGAEKAEAGGGSPKALVEFRFDRHTPLSWVTPILEMCVETAVGIQRVRVAPIEGTEAPAAPVPGVVTASVVDLAAIDYGKSGSRVRLGGFTWTLEEQAASGSAEEDARDRKRRTLVLKEIAAAAVRLATGSTPPALRFSATGPEGVVACQDIFDVLGALRPAGFARVEFVATALPVREPSPSVASPERATAPTAPSFDATRWPPAVVAFLGDWAVPEGKVVDKVTGYPAKIRRTKDDMVMVLIPGGTFLMGAVPTVERPCIFEVPRHSVTLTKAYYFDEHEVTNGQFSKFADAWPDFTSHEADGETSGVDEYGDMGDVSGISWRKPQPGAAPLSNWNRHPVVLVTWTEADAYAAWVGPRRELERPPTEAVGLPTEAQFERALRGGVDGEMYWWGNSSKFPVGAGNYGDETMNRRYRLKEQGRWHGVLVGYEDGFLFTAPVKSFRPNRYGLFDLGGNVWEWCWDRNDKEIGYPTASEVVDPLGAEKGSRRQIRGGSFLSIDWGGTDPGETARSSNRVAMRVEFRMAHLGFRCARSLP